MGFSQWSAGRGGSKSLSGLGHLSRTALAVCLAAIGLSVLAAPSQAASADHDLNVDHGKMTLGAVLPDKTIIPAPVATADCPSVPPNTGEDPNACGPSPLSALVPNYPDGNAHIKVSEENGIATVAAADFKTPMTYVPSPFDDQMVPIKTSAPNGLSGTWNSTTGKLSLTGDLRIDVATGATGQSPADISWCRIDAPGITWSTGLNAVTPGVPFADPSGLDGTGAISASWADLPDGVSINGGDCSTVNAVIHDTGAIWFGVGKDSPPPPPVCEPPLEGLWPDCYNELVVDHANIKIGTTFPNQVVIPAATPGPLSYPPRFNTPPGYGTIKVSVDGTDASVSAAGFKLPTLSLPWSPTDIPLVIEAPNGLTGTFSAGGDLDLTGDLLVTAFDGYERGCRLTLPTATLSTGTTQPFHGVRFNQAQGLEGNGAIAVSWDSVSPGTPWNGGDCSLMNDPDNISKPGALWLSSGISTPFELTVAMSGDGEGRVTSAPTGIDCGTVCSKGFADSTVVTLTATPASGSSFTGWSGACTGTGSCEVTVDQARNVTATFTEVFHELKVTRSGTGQGKVTSSPGGIDCGTVCLKGIADNTVVTLTATPASGSSFTGWSGACTGTGSCEVTMDQARTVNAGFDKDPPPPPPSPTPSVQVTSVKLRPAKHTMRAGGKFMLVVRVANGGDLSGWVTVQLRLNRTKGVALRRQTRVKAFANSFGQVKVPFRATRRAAGRYRVTATAAGKQGKATITVKKAKRR